ncbi:FCD domain-containing protein [Streptomyces canus]|uniref:FCD domain-containing protein n=1 Tax=Streptomyces canus TaxID=58343 RepID=UPI0036B9E97A
MRVQEALFTLMDYGVVQLVARRGVRIIGLSRASRFDRDKVIGVLSGTAARWATPRTGIEPPARRRDLEEIRLGGMSADQRAQATYRFHAEINRGCGSPELIHCLGLANSSTPMDFGTRAPDHWAATDREHLDLIEAFGRGDQDDAARIVEKHSAVPGIMMAEMLPSNDLLADD